MDIKPKTQKPIDNKAIKEAGGQGENTRGGRYDTKHKAPSDSTTPKFRFNGIRIADNGPDTWGVGQGTK